MTIMFTPRSMTGVIMITPSDKQTAKAVLFSKTFHYSKEELISFATKLGLLKYQPFDASSTHDDLLINLEPYGIYTFTDGSQASVSTIGN